jgi:hypothetical protein
MVVPLSWTPNPHFPLGGRALEKLGMFKQLYEIINRGSHRSDRYWKAVPSLRTVSGCVFMKSTTLGFGLIVLLVIAVAFAGCSGTSTTPTTSGGQAATQAAGGASSGSSAAGGSVSAASLFGNLGYEWVEYKMVAGTGAEKMTIYYKYNQKTGKCSMRFEGGAAMQGMPTEMDCSSTGSAQASSNPNDVGSDVKLVKVGTESVTVPAGTFVADKYTATVGGNTATYWIAAGKPLIKMEGGNAEGKAIMELNSWG